MGWVCVMRRARDDEISARWERERERDLTVDGSRGNLDIPDKDKCRYTFTLKEGETSSAS